MDIITKSYFQKFITRNNITGGLSDHNFEIFVNNLIFNSINARGFELHRVATGGGCDAGIDGIGITINGKFIYSLSELEGILQNYMEFKVEFHFVQSKTSEKFESKEISNFIDGVFDMFSPSIFEKKKISGESLDRYKMIQLIMENFEYAKTRKCFLYYVTAGDYIEDDNHKSSIAKGRKMLKDLEIFEDSSIQINIFDKNEIRKRYERIQVKNKAEFELSNKIEIPFIEGVTESYFAIMKIKEYFSIVIDSSNDEIRNGIFELNVRDFGGVDDNRVNSDIEKTINSEKREHFGLLNNGITIVGERLEKARGKYIISNFYVVNGCQTTNVLYDNKEKIDENMWISLKIVITEKTDLINDIVKATNNQTEVAEIQLLSMDEYQNVLESYYKSEDRWKQLYYERRDGQYRGIKNISNLEIISPEKQIKTFASIFLKSPHISSRYAGKLQDEISKSIFIDKHNPIMYYTSSLINYRLEKMFLNQKINIQYNKFHQHILYLISLLVWENRKMPSYNSKNKMEEYCIPLIDIGMDENKFNEKVEESIEILNVVVEKIDSTEITKSGKLVNLLGMYVHLGITEKQLVSLMSLTNWELGYYKKPIKAISIDGDLRFNLIDRLYDLITYIYAIINKDFKNSSIVQAYEKIFLVYEENKDKNELTRDDRREIASIVLENTSIIEKESEKIIKLSQRYTNIK